MALSLTFGSHAAHSLACRMHADFGAIEHLDASDIKGMGRTSAHDLHKGGDADAHQLALLALLFLLLPELLVSHFIQSLLHVCIVVAAIVAPTQRRFVREG